MSGNHTLEGKTLITALNMLENVTTIFEDENIRYSITAGTLLGIVRENRLLPWDRDLDLRVFYPDREKLIRSIRKIRKAGYIVRLRYQEKDDPPLIKGDLRIIKIYSRKKVVLKGDVMMDCFIATKYDDMYVWSCGGDRKYTKKAVPAHFYDNLEKSIFSGKTYYMPIEREKYLKYRYGDWQTPQKKWRFTKDDLAIIATDHKPKRK
jgi:phosphorylcholine metabolism protein LicD